MVIINENNILENRIVNLEKQLSKNEQYRSLNSHGFTVCHGRFFISHGFTNFQWIFAQTYNFLRKQTRQYNPLSKILWHYVLYIQKINNSVIFDFETFTRSSFGNDCPVNHQKFYEKYPSSINLIKIVLFRDSFCNNLEISQSCYQKCLCWNVSIKYRHKKTKDSQCA